ncbi:MAG: AI-2E family transporter [Parcubacteria group bacterium]|jgi:predicted PurR-regulated permease PerM
MILKNFNIYFFLALLIAGSVAGFLLVKPFLSAIFIAALFAVMFIRPYDYLVEKTNSPAISSALMLCVVAFVIILPVIFVSGLIVNEVSDVIRDGATENSSTQQSIQKVVETVSHVPFLNLSFDHLREYVSEQEVSNLVKNASNTVVSFVQKTYFGVVNGVINIFVMFFTLFYFFIDGRRFVRYAMQLSPLQDKHEKDLVHEFISMARATLKGTVVIGCIQGSIGGVAFAIAGIVSPVLWTVVMVVFAIIPAAGAGVVIFPTAIVMLLLGHVWQAVFLAVVGTLVSIIDNILRPKLVGNDTQMHSLAVLFATLGGLKLFGFIGFVVGPIIVALMLAMWKIYATEFKKELERFNA